MRSVIRSHLEAQGRLIDSDDLQIATIALTNPLTLVTHTLRAVSRVAGVQLEDGKT